MLVVATRRPVRQNLSNGWWAYICLPTSRRHTLTSS